jgi:hypothetical protein
MTGRPSRHLVPRQLTAPTFETHRRTLGQRTIGVPESVVAVSPPDEQPERDAAENAEQRDEPPLLPPRYVRESDRWRGSMPSESAPATHPHYGRSSQSV